MQFLKRLFYGDKGDPREQLVAMFGGEPPSGGGAPQVAIGWAQSVIDPTSMDKIAAIRAMREAKPELSLSAGKYLADQVFHARSG